MDDISRLNIDALLTAEQLARKFGCSSSHVRRLRLDGKIHGTYVGKAWRFASDTEDPRNISPRAKWVEMGTNQNHVRCEAAKAVESTAGEKSIMRNTMTIMEESNLEVFKPDSVNRPTDRKKLGKLKKSIQRKNLLMYYPIVVSADFTIRDGHHRYFAAKELGLSLFYIISDSMEIEDVADAASVQTQWKESDYIYHFASRGFKDYVAITQFVKKFPWITPSVAVDLCHYGDARHADSLIKSGDYVANSIEFAEIVASSVFDFAAYITFYSRKVFISTIRNLLQNKKYNHARMMRKMKFKSSSLKPCTDVPSYISLIEGIYNFKESEVDRVPLRKVYSGSADFLSAQDVVERVKSGR